MALLIHNYYQLYAATHTKIIAATKKKVCVRLKKGMLNSPRRQSLKVVELSKLAKHYGCE